MFFSPEDLQGVDLDSVAMTAVVNADGTLGPVGGLWQKLEPDTIDLAGRGLLRFVVVAEEQHDVHPQYLREDPQLPLVLKAKTVQDAIGQLNAHLLPRRAILHHEYAQCQHLDILGRPVPIATHYHQLPLLRAVKRERLLRRPSANHSTPENHTQEAEAHGSLRTLDLARWEELLREECITYEPVSAEQLFSAFSSVVKEAKSAVPRWVVLGPPGSGKSTFMQYLAWRAATGDGRLFARSFIPARVRLREWEAWSVKPAAPEASLPSYLAEQYKDLTHAPTAAQWRQWLQRGEVLLLLDGLDEIESKAPFLHALGTALLIFKECPTVITCRTVIFEDHRALCPDFPVFTLSGLDITQQELCIRAFPAEYTDHYDPEAVIRQLRDLPQMRALTANALLLNILCFVIDDPRGVRLPATRGAFYDKAIEKLLTRPRRVQVQYPDEEPNGDEQRAILERLALHLFARADQRLTFSGDALRQALKQALHEEEAPALWANPLRKDWLHNSGILRGSSEQRLFFLHLTLQEFLAAAALARIINNEGWETPVHSAGRTMSIRRLVDTKAWDQRWHEVIVLLAGQLKNPAPLFTLLMQHKRDDLFCHRLALAALCLPERQPSRDEDFMPVIDRVTSQVFSLWLQHEKNATAAAVPHLSRALPALAQLNGRCENRPLLEWLLQHLGSADEGVRAAIVEAMGRMGAFVAQYAEAITALRSGLSDADALVRARAVTAFRRIGTITTLSAEILQTLRLAANHDPDWFVRFGAAQAIAQLEHFPSSPADLVPIRNTVSALLPKAKIPPPAAARLSAPFEKGGSEGAAERGICTAGQSNEIESYSDRLLVQMLREGNEGDRRRAAHMVKKIDTTVSPDREMVNALLEVALHDKNGGIRAEAAAALGHIGTTTQHAGVPVALARLARHDRDAGVRAEAAAALGRQGNHANQRHEVLTALMSALQDEESDVRSSAAEALGRLMSQGIRVFQRRWNRLVIHRVQDLTSLRK